MVSKNCVEQSTMDGCCYQIASLFAILKGLLYRTGEHLVDVF